MNAPVQIDVWSDYVCPFCYLELPVLDRVAEQYGDRVSIRWRAFELRPEPVPTLEPDGDYLVNTWRDAVYPMAERRGMLLKLPPVQPRSRNALVLTEYARREGRFAPVHKALFEAFFVEGRDIGETSVLVDIASRCGLAEEGVVAALSDAQLLRKVLEDEEIAHDLGISGVPSLVIHREDSPETAPILLTGAQAFEAIEQVISRVSTGLE